MRLSVGYQILEVEDGERGVTAAGRNRPDLILMDIQMPTLDGYEANAPGQSPAARDSECRDVLCLERG